MVEAVAEAVVDEAEEEDEDVVLLFADAALLELELALELAPVLELELELELDVLEVLTLLAPQTAVLYVPELSALFIQHWPELGRNDTP